MIRHEPVVESFPRVGRVRSLVDKPTPVNRPDVRQNGPVLIVTGVVGVAAVAVIVLCVRRGAWLKHLERKLVAGDTGVHVGFLDPGGNKSDPLDRALVSGALDKTLNVCRQAAQHTAAR